MTKTAEPLPWEKLVDYWAGELKQAESELVEEHVFACVSCAQALEDVSRLARGIAERARAGSAGSGISDTLLERLEREGRIVRRFRAGPGETIHCGAGLHDDMVVLELQAELAGAPRVDLVLLDADGTIHRHATDLPVVRGREVVWSEAGETIRAMPAQRFTLRLVAPTTEGQRTLAEYTLDHRPIRFA